MAGLYVHIPFCRSKCAYCDFFSMPVKCQGGDDTTRRYCDALLKEFDIRKGEIDGPFETVYIGGGTPSALDVGLLTYLFDGIRERITTPGKAIKEWTVEANPEDITPAFIDAMREAGVNRISIGIQSFDPAQLSAVERRHSAQHSFRALENLRDSGINYSADLIYGLPGQDLKSWCRQLETLLEFRPPHFSAYLLSYEPGTRLYVRREAGKVEEATEALAVEMYSMLTSIAADQGYDHYEISNFALKGKRAVHNSSYWNLTPYLGLGCSAHSFDGHNRRYNPSNLRKYLDTISRNQSYVELDEENDINRINDYIITSLRTSEGLSISQATQLFGKKLALQLQNNINSNINLLESYEFNNNVRYKIQEDKWLISDSILRELII